MNNTERYTDRLAKYIIISASIAIIGSICWVLKSVLAYILIAVVVSLLAKPVMNLSQKLKIKGRALPDWLLATISLVLVLGTITTILSCTIPIISRVAQNISVTNITEAVKGIAVPLENFNHFLQERVPSLGKDFRIEVAVLQEIQKLFNINAFNVIGSAASVMTQICVAIFSIIFISFFFIKDNGLFTKIVCAFVPEKHEKNVEEAICDIEHLLSRYFSGVTLEIIGVAIINFLGLWLIARLNINAAAGIAFITGILNIIPYVGPFAGITLGTILGLLLKYSSAVPTGLDLGFWGFTAVLIAILYFTQLVDNFLYQPVIYSTSIKSTPLEIFIVLLIVGNLGGPLAMIIAIPVYTIFRVVAFRFFRHIKAINRLIPSEKLISKQ